MKDSRGAKFLVIRRDNIGDLVCTTPLMAARSARADEVWRCGPSDRSVRSYSDTPCAAGAQGAQGVVGPPGVQGPQGSQGLTGATGALADPAIDLLAGLLSDDEREVRKAAAGALIDHLVEKSKSALVDRGLIELKNLIADPAQSSRIEKLRAALAAECKRTEAPFALEP